MSVILDPVWFVQPHVLKVLGLFFYSIRGHEVVLTQMQDVCLSSCLGVA